MVAKCGSLGFLYSTLMTNTFAHTLTRLEPATDLSQIRAPLQLQLKNTPRHESLDEMWFTTPLAPSYKPPQCHTLELYISLLEKFDGMQANSQFHQPNLSHHLASTLAIF